MKLVVINDKKYIHSNYIQYLLCLLYLIIQRFHTTQDQTCNNIKYTNFSSLYLYFITLYFTGSSQRSSGFFSRLHGLHACIDLQDGVRCSDDRVMLGHVGQVMFAPARYFAVRVTG